MELGEKLLIARQEANLSQRQLSEGIVTRNMLSLIEHGSARPSMDTLRLLAARLGKPMSWFLEEEIQVSPNQSLMARAESLWEAGEGGAVWLLLKDFRLPDPVLERQWRCLSAEAGILAAEQAAAEGKERYARQLLEEVGQIPHGMPELERQRLIRLGRIHGGDLQKIVKVLPSLDEELLLRAEAALEEKNSVRVLALLDAAEDHLVPRWSLLRGQALMLAEDYAGAARCLMTAEAEYPKVCRPLLEVCFRESGDYRMAYEYACRQR